MESNWQIETNRAALKRILASLIAMAGLAGRWPGSPPPLSGGPERSAGVGVVTRGLRLAVLRILRPAEAATRRLVVAMARSLLHEALSESCPLRRFAPPPPLRRGGSAAATPARPGSSPVHGGSEGRARPAARPGKSAKRRRGRPVAAASPAPTRFSFRMVDTLPQLHPPRRCWVRQTAMPRISGFYSPRAKLVLPPLPKPSDLLEIAPLARRLAALAHALDNLPARAKRFARWRANRLRMQAEGKTVRASPLKPGRPPGGRLSTYDPDRPRSRRIREIDEILVHTHSMARYALEKPDSS